MSVVPGILSEWWTDEWSVSNLRSGKALRNLLGRDPVVVDNDGIHSFFRARW